MGCLEAVAGPEVFVPRAHKVMSSRGHAHSVAWGIAGQALAQVEVLERRGQVRRPFDSELGAWVVVADGEVTPKVRMMDRHGAFYMRPASSGFNDPVIPDRSSAVIGHAS
jgi:hypothetical protein